MRKTNPQPQYSFITNSNGYEPLKVVHRVEQGKPLNLNECEVITQIKQSGMAGAEECAIRLRKNRSSHTSKCHNHLGGLLNVYYQLHPTPSEILTQYSVGWDQQCDHCDTKYYDNQPSMRNNVEGIYWGD